MKLKDWLAYQPPDEPTNEDEQTASGCVVCPGR